MQGDEPTNKPELAGLSFRDWLARIEEIGEERGYFEPLGKRHSAIFTDEGPTLLVCFETVEGVRQSSETHEPIGWELCGKHGWSNLCLLSHGDTWFRDKAVYGYFDRLVDDGFFEDFDRVIFYGAGMGGYAAAAYSVVAPGATVIALQPQATLDGRMAEWDDRYPDMRRTSFTDRYGYAPAMMEAAGRGFIIYDPEEKLDAMHASLFEAKHVRRLRCRNLGTTVEAELWGMGVLPGLIEQAGEGALDEAAFFRAYRARRDHLPYLRNLLSRLERSRRHRLVEMLCNGVLANHRAPRFRKARDEARRLLGEPAREEAPAQ